MEAASGSFEDMPYTRETTRKIPTDSYPFCTEKYPANILRIPDFIAFFELKWP